MRLIEVADGRVAWFGPSGDDAADGDALDAMVVELFGGWDGVTVREAEPPTP